MVTSFVWTENQYKRDSNTIASCILHYLQNVPDWTPYTAVHLIADSCAGQNKNTTILAMLPYWMLFYAPNTVKDVKLVFPVTGHSYIPPTESLVKLKKKNYEKKKLFWIRKR